MPTSFLSRPHEYLSANADGAFPRDSSTIAYGATKGVALNNKLPIVLMAFLVLLAPPGALAGAFPDKPSPDHYYVDEAGLIDRQAGARIDHTAATLLAERKVPLYVVTISSLAEHGAAGMSIERYATALFNRWGIGWKERNYGILLLISRKDREARIELGADWGAGSNPQARRVMDTIIVPAFKRGDYSAGIGDAVQGLDAMARGLARQPASTPGWMWLAWIGGTILIGVMLTLYAIVRRWFFDGGIDSSSYGCSGSGGSGGGFGGGSSDGGGDSGSW